MGSCCCPPAEKEKVQSNNKSKKASKNKSRKKTTKAEKSKSSSKAPGASKACQLSKGVVDPQAKGASTKMKVKNESGKSGLEGKAAPRSSSAGASKLAQSGPLGATSSSTVNLSKYSFTASSVHSRSSGANSQALSGVSATATGTKDGGTPKSRTNSNPKTVVFSKALSTVSESLSKTFESKAVK